MRATTRRAHPGYRGPDRRRPPEPPPRRRGAVLAAALGAAGLGGAGGLAAAAAVGGVTSGAGLGSLTTPVDAVAAILAGHLALTAWICTRATGEAIGARLSGSAAFVAVALVVDLGDPADGGPAVVRTAALLLAAAWAAAAVLGPAVEDARRLVRQALLTLIVVGVLALVTSLAASGGPPMSSTAASALAAAGWIVALGAWLRTIRRRPTALLAWAVLVPATFAAAELVRLAPGADGALQVTSATLRIGGLFAASIGIAVELAAHAVGRRAELLQVEADRRATEHRVQQRTEEREHEVANALLAVEGATSMMSSYAGRLDEATRRELAAAVASGLARLRALLGEADGDDGGGSSDADLTLAPVVHERAALARSRGVRSVVTGDLEVVARGDAGMVGQVIDNLLLNAVRHGGAGTGEPVTIDLAVEAGRAVIRVSDDGPGIPAHARTAVFERGFQLTPDSPGAGLGLYVSRRLVRALGGDLTVEEAPKGGACLVVSLPLGSRTGDPVATR